MKSLHFAVFAGAVFLSFCTAQGTVETAVAKCSTSFVFGRAYIGELTSIQASADRTIDVRIDHPADTRPLDKRDYSDTISARNAHYVYTGWLYPSSVTMPTTRNALYSWVASHPVKNIFNVDTVKLAVKTSLQTGDYYFIAKTKCVCPRTNPKCALCANPACTQIQSNSFHIVNFIAA
jgi:hypothetical protein